MITLSLQGDSVGHRGDTISQAVPSIIALLQRSLLLESGIFVSYLAQAGPDRVWFSQGWSDPRTEDQSPLIAWPWR